MYKRQQEQDRTEQQESSLNRWNRMTKEKSMTDSHRNTIKAREGAIWSNIQENAKHTKVHKGDLVYRGILFTTLFMMLSGIFMYRLGIFHDCRNVAGYWWWTAGSLVVALGVNYIRYQHWTYHYLAPETNVVKGTLYVFSRQSLAIAYALLLNGLYQWGRECFSALFKLFIPIGRMALSNYLFKSFICLLYTSPRPLDEL